MPSPSLRFPPPRESGGEASDGDVIFKYKGTNYSKNEYFFGHNNQVHSGKYLQEEIIGKPLYHNFLII